MATVRGHAEIVQLLIEYGANRTLVPPNEKSLFLAAVEHGTKE
jgi:hypothetical protein